MFIRPVIATILVAAVLAACSSPRDKEAGLAALKESPSMQREVVNRCMERPVQLNPLDPLDQQVINDLGPVQEGERMRMICERVVAGLARGTLTFQDLDQVGKGMFTPAMRDAIRTPAKLPVTAGRPKT
jgi:hypothetical protein